MPSTNGHGPQKRAILYARVSTEEQARSGYSLAQQMEALREFAEHGCKLRALNDRGDDSPEGQLTDGILDQIAKFERAKIAERTRRGRLRRAREGKIISGRMPNYGFRYDATGDSYEVDETTMPVVRRIFDLIVQSASVTGTKKKLE